ncbi:hypothetical protein G6F42_029158 [Rhizopus arrhizus]|nr:hypothetical protein G6F42_029158 [Rhizopus arrhizus]
MSLLRLQAASYEGDDSAAAAGRMRADGCIDSFSDVALQTLAALYAGPRLLIPLASPTKAMDLPPSHVPH